MLPAYFNEKLLQFIWQFQYISKQNITTVAGEAVQVIFQGEINKNQGPDFLNAKIKIQNTTWIGNIELHLKTSDWHKHHHTQDENYANIILHVVWEHDEYKTPKTIPVLELQPLVPVLMLEKYSRLMQSQDFCCMQKSASGF